MKASTFFLILGAGINVIMVIFSYQGRLTTGSLIYGLIFSTVSFINAYIEKGSDRDI